jgi:predicted Ser/Thr protein kinase
MDTTKKIARYEILEELGRGAMGTVYRAKDPAMDRVVALKTIIAVVLASQQGDEFRERFYREARAAGALAHPGIVPVFDVGEHEGMPFLVMEFVTGRTLAEVAKGERLSLDRVCEIGQKIAEALGYAHQRGVVHRDIKPANILLTSREVYGIERPKITDFGVAKLAEGQTTLTGQILGTPAFMPPEQFTGAPIDGRADIFSLGVVLYWMATGEQPFPGESMTAVSYKVVHTDPVPPRKLNPSVPPKLESIVLKCLAKNPAERYQTGEALARDIGELRAGDKAATLQTVAAQRAVAGVDPDATVVESIPMMPAVAPAPVATPRPAARTAAPRSKPDSRLILLGVSVLALVALGGWYALRGRQRSTVQVQQVQLAPTPPPAASVAPVASPPDPVAAEPAAPSEPASAAPPAPAAPAKARASVAAAPVAAKVVAKKPEAKTDAKVEAATAPLPRPAEAAPEPAALGFDPKALDPKQNARLKIDVTQMPPGLDFTVEMNGKLYFRKTAAGGNIQDEQLFVPPGLQQFWVTAKSAGVEKTSNTVGADFKANKRNTLKIELRTEGASPGSGMPQGLYPDTQIVLTLK